MTSPTSIRWFDDPDRPDVALVGGKNASLAEMTVALASSGIPVPDGFATTSEAYRNYLQANDLTEPIGAILRKLATSKMKLDHAGDEIRKLILGGSFPEEIEREVRNAYVELGRRANAAALQAAASNGVDVDIDPIDVAVAVRSSATAEDLPEASFAGQLESFLNVRGSDALLDAVRECFASLFTDRAISYRTARGFDHMDVAVSVGVQRMVRSDQAAAGVMFTIDTETGFPDVTIINASWGLGETVVKGRVTPDQFTIYTPHLGREGVVPIIGRVRGTKKWKLIYGDGPDEPTVEVETSSEERSEFALVDDEILTLARWGRVIEEHYERPMDIEWAKDGPEGGLFVVQARPETVQSRLESSALKTYTLKESGDRLVTGLAIGAAISSGPVCLIENASEIERFEDGSILVTDTTDPDWVPVMKRAAGIVTNSGGRTSHAAIVSRELGVPAIVGTGNATEVLEPGESVTLSCAEGEEGVVYAGELAFEEEEIDLSNIPEVDTRIMMNIASPAAAMHWWRLPARGIGLARMEYVINNVIKIHPMALLRPDEVDDDARREIEALTKGFDPPETYFVDLLAEGIATIAASQAPEPVIVRMSDFKTNEYAGLIGGRAFEPKEENPMLGWRGASRYYSDEYRQGFALECRAVAKVRQLMGFDNVIIMIPFCRTLEEADRVLDEMEANGLKRGENGLKVYVMAEIPSNILLADDFSERFDGFSIGSNDLTQLTLGVDRDSARLSYLFDERNEAVKRSIRMLIDMAHAADRPVGICGQGPSDYPEFAQFLVDAGIDSVSVLPDSVIQTIRSIADQGAERGAGHGAGVDANREAIAGGTDI